MMKRFIIGAMLILGLCSWVKAQKIDVRIRVVDEWNRPLQGVMMRIGGNDDESFLSDKDGMIECRADKGAELNFEKYNQLQRKLKVTGEVMTVKLDKDNRLFELGYDQRVTKENTTAAIDGVSADEMKLSGEINPLNTLYGLIPGLGVYHNGSLPYNSTPDIYVRGMASNQGNKVLVLVDGVEREIGSLNVDEIESVTVLKDAASLALYGNRGTDGVICVTTKRGGNNKMRTHVGYNFTVQTPFRIPGMADAVSYANAVNEALGYDGLAPRYTQADIQALQNGTSPLAIVDWKNQILRKTAFNHDLNLSFDGANERMRYYVFANYTSNRGFFNNTDLNDGYSTQVEMYALKLRTNLEANISPTTMARMNLMGRLMQYQQPTGGTSLANVYNTPVIAAPIYDRNGVWAKNQMFTNPLAVQAANGYGQVLQRTLFADLTIEQDLSMITKGLSAKVQGSWDTQSLFGEARYKMPELNEALKERNPNGTLSFEKIADEKTVTYSSAAWGWRKLYLEANVNYDRTFGDHRLGGLLFYYIEDTSETGADKSMNAIPKRYQSLSGRFTYGFKDTYFWDLNFGLNGSENFEPGKQYGFFPAGAFAWVPSSYEFIRENVSWLNFLKLRVSYGVVGNDRISSRRFPYLTLIKEENASNPWGGTGSLTEEQVGANNLMWEKAKKFDVGMDLHLFKDKFTLTLDYFKDTRDGIFQERKQIPDYVGLIQMPYGNIGRMKSWGADGNMEFYQQIGKDAHVILRSNFTLSKNKILNWEDTKKPYTYLENNGYANNVQRGFVAMGLFKDQQDVEMSPTQFGTVRPGDIKYRDINGDGKITDDDKVPLFAYSGVPQLMYGIGAEFRYKSWTLNVLFKGTGRNKFLYGGSDGRNFDGYMPFNQKDKGNIMTIAYNPENRWISAEYSGNQATENPNARFPRLYYGKNENNTKPSTFWMGDARYLRLQELSLAYNLKVPALQRILGINSMNIQLMCENLAVWDSVNIFDPEQATSCGQAYPLPARYSLQLYLNF